MPRTAALVLQNAIAQQDGWLRSVRRRPMIATRRTRKQATGAALWFERVVAALCFAGWCLLVVVLTGCAGPSPSATTSGLTTGSVSQVSAPYSTDAFAPPTTDAFAPATTVTEGPRRVALLVPLEHPDKLGQTLETAAKLALADVAMTGAAPLIDLVTIDTGTDAADVVAAAEQARAMRADLVVGPIYAADVAAASQVLSPAGIPIVALTSDTARAAPGVYLNAFTPEADTQRIMAHAAAVGSTHVVAFVPRTRYGKIVLDAARSELAARGAQIAFVADYDGSAEGFDLAARTAAIAAEGADTIWIPAGGEAPRAMLQALNRSGVDLSGKRILGSGQWQRATVDPLMEGALFASNDAEAFRSFAFAYEAGTAVEPPVIAALAYDAVAIAAQIAGLASRHRTVTPFGPERIADPAGFKGATGLFRFRRDGTVERKLAIFAMRGGKPVMVVKPAGGFGAAQVARGY